jgi:drug/metabolite transporter (DMT)-like permease
MSFFPSALHSAIGRRLVPLAFLSIFLIWGTTFLAISYGLRGFPPFLLSALRFLSAGTILLLWQYARGERITVLANWRRNAVPGFFILTAGTGLVGWSEQYVTSSEAAIMGATAPFWFIVLDRKNRKDYFSDRLVLTGIIGGFFGLILFVNGSMSAAHAAHPSGTRITAFSVLALSAISWVLGSVYSKRNPATGTNLLNTAQQLVAGGLGSLVISIVRGEPAEAIQRTVPLSAWAGLIFLILFGSIIAYQSYIWLLSIRPPAIVSVHTYINPVVAVVAGWIFLQEVATGLQLAGLVIILTGVFLTNMSRYKIRIRTRVRIRQKLRYAMHAVQTRPSWAHRGGLKLYR